MAAKAHVTRGETAYDAGRLEDVLVDYNAAIAIDPGPAPAHVGMFNTLATMGRAAGAPGGCGQAFHPCPARAEPPAQEGRTLEQPGGSASNAGRDGDNP